MEHHRPAGYAAGRTALEPWLTVADVAATVKKSRGFIYGLVRDGELEPVRVGAHLRFDPSDVRAYLERHREKVVSSP